MIRKRNSCKNIFIICFFVAVLVFVKDGFCIGEERILSFDSNIKINEDSSLMVIETIRVQSAGQNIQHGIYRDFPVKYKDKFGNNYYVDFEILNIEKNGISENYHLKNLSNGIRIYIGNKNFTIPTGEYTYRITYKTSRQIGFFSDYDELYWNVTGNGWIFPIDKASATIELPLNASENILSTDGYTGPYGSIAKNFIVYKDNSGRVVFSTTKSLRAYEGFTIVLSWAKGFVIEPTAQMNFVYFLQDNKGSIFGIIGFFIVLIYYLIVWTKIGKDPKKGVIIPLYNSPENLSPASVRYIAKMGYDHKVFAAALINMAVKGFIKINEEKGKYTIIRNDKPDIRELNIEEKRILTAIGEEIELKTINHEKIGNTIDNVKSVLKDKYEKIYFVTNFKYFLYGALFSVIAILISAFMYGTKGQDPVALFLCVWLTGWSFGVVFLLSQAITQWKYVILGTKIKWVLLGNAIFISLFALPFIIAEVAVLFVFTKLVSFFGTGLFLCIILLNVLFYYLLKAPTLLGRNIMDKIEGFKMFLSVSEKENLNVSTSIDKSPEIFEKYLPYALALDVENEWAEKFSNILSNMKKGGNKYIPVWYSGTTFSSMGISDFTSSFGSSFSSAIASSATAPGSGSGGGGSGGGGGGGGGGGW